MKQYQQYIVDILNRGVVKSDRTGVGTVSAFGHFLRFDLSEGFPLLTLKRTNFKGIKAELLWFLEGSTDNNRLRELGATIWDEWATESGELGPIYGYQWRSWPLPYEKDPRGLVQRVMDAIKGVPAPRKPYDQIRHIQFQLRINPTNRRLVLTGWNPEFLPDAGFSPRTNVEMGKQALPPCHMSFVFNATPIRVEDRIELGVRLGKFRSAVAVTKGLEIRLKGVDPDDVDRVSQAWLTEEFGVPEYRLNGLLTMRSQLSAA